MKKLLIIVLIVCFVVSISIVALAKVKFGSWDKWDEELPPADHESWYWAISTNQPRTLILKGWGEADSDVILLFSDLCFYKTKSGKTRASVIFYSLGNVVENAKDWDIPNAHFALAGFPSEKGKMTIRAYKMEEMKGTFKFFEEWKIPFKDYEIVVAKDRKFYEEFKIWIKNQTRKDIDVPNEEFLKYTLPTLKIWKENFMISDAIPPK